MAYPMDAFRMPDGQQPIAAEPPTEPLIQGGTTTASSAAGFSLAKAVKWFLLVAGVALIAANLGYVVDHTARGGVILAAGCNGRNCGSTSVDPQLALVAALTATLPAQSVTNDYCVNATERDTATLRATFCAAGRTVASYACVAGTPCYVRLTDVKSMDSGVTLVNNALRVNASNNYYVRFTVQVTSECPVAQPTLPLSLVDAGAAPNAAPLASFSAGSGKHEFCFVTPVLLPGTRLALRIDGTSKLYDSDLVSVSGSVSTSSDFAVMNTTYTVDINRQSAWIPSRPALPVVQPAFPPQYPNATSSYTWWSPVIPSQLLNLTAQQLAARGLPNGDAYQKFDSVVQGIPFYVDIDINTISPKDPKLTIFVVNLEDRGFDNLKKKQYMHAISTTVMPFYKERMQTLINRIHADFTAYQLPVLSSFQDANIEFFLDLHLGAEQHPEYIKQYFRDFSSYIAKLNQTELYVTIQRILVPQVRAHFAARIAKVIADGNKETFTYWWNIAGMNPEQVLTEAVHNWVAIQQFINIINKLARDQVSGTPVPLSPDQRTAFNLPATIKYDFLAKFAAATTENEQLDVARELMRLLSPNGISFSKLVTNPSNSVQPAPGTRLQGRHVHQGMMIAGEVALAGGSLPTGVSQYLAYSTAKYAPFSTNFSVNLCPGLSPEGDSLPGAAPFNLDPYFVKANVGTDQETVLDKCNPAIAPVYPVSRYTPFGLGYRRCPGEMFTMQWIVMMLAKLQGVTFSLCTAPADRPTVPVAPFELAPNNLCAAAAA